MYYVVDANPVVEGGIERSFSGLWNLLVRNPAESGAEGVGGGMLVAGEGEGWGGGGKGEWDPSEWDGWE